MQIEKGAGVKQHTTGLLEAVFRGELLQGLLLAWLGRAGSGQAEGEVDLRRRAVASLAPHALGKKRRLSIGERAI